MESIKEALIVDLNLGPLTHALEAHVLKVALGITTKSVVDDLALGNDEDLVL